MRIGRALSGGRLLNASRTQLLKNAAGLYGVQFAHFLLPLITVPFLARILGPGDFGRFTACQSLAFILQILVEYGFAGSASREVVREDDGTTSRVQQTVASVLGAKAFLTLATLVVMIILTAFVALLREDLGLATLTWVSAIAAAFNPWWYFWSKERALGPALVTIVTRVGAVAATLLLVRHPGDGALAMGINAVAALASTAVVSVAVYREVPFLRPRVAASIAALRRGFGIFLGTGMSSLYTSTSVFLLGLLVTPATVALFAGPDRIVRAVTRLTGPAAMAAYPRVISLIARGEGRRANQLAGLVVLGLGLGTTAVSAGMFVFADQIVTLVLGKGYGGAVSVLQILALMPPLNAVSNSIRLQWLLPHNRDYLVVRILGIGAVVNVVAAIPLVAAFGVKGMAAGVVGVEALVAVLSAVAVFQLRDRTPTRAPADSEPLTPSA